MSLALPFQTAKQLAAAVRKKKIGCLELLDLYLKRVDAHNPRLNAIIATDIEGARKRAKAADKAVKAGKKLGPLHGVPMTIKESYDVAGLPHDLGPSRLQGQDRREELAGGPAHDRRRRDALRQDQRAAQPRRLAELQRGLRLDQQPVGPVAHAGGSSGGSGAALAAGLTGIEAGSDIGGSIRNPASYNGVWGHKPSWGVVSGKGHALNGRVAQADITVCGPLARGAEDLEIAMDVMAGPDEIDGRGWTLSLPRPKKKKLRDFKVGVILSDPNAEVDHSVQSEIQKLADFLGKKKVKVSDKARPAIDTAELNDVYVRMLRATTSGRMSDEEFREALRDAAALPDDDMSYFAQMQRGNTLSHRTWTQLNEKRHRMRLAWDAFFKDYDLMICAGGADGRLSARPEGHPPRAHHRGEQQEAAGGRPDLLGGLRQHHAAAGDGGAGRRDQGGTAGRRADHRPAIRRLLDHRLRQAPGEGISRLRAAAGLRLTRGMP